MVTSVCVWHTVFLWPSPHYSIILAAQKKTNRHDSKLLAGVRVHRNPPEAMTYVNIGKCVVIYINFFVEKVASMTLLDCKCTHVYLVLKNTIISPI
jgi:hypothetical protein